MAPLDDVDVASQQFEDLRGEVLAEVEAWQLLGERVRALGQNAEALAQAAEATLAGVEGWVGQAFNPGEVDGARWAETMQAHLDQANREAQNILTRLQTALGGIVDGAVSEVVDAVEDTVSLFTDSAQQQIDDIQSSLDVFASDLTDDWPERLERAGGGLVESVEKVSAALDEEMVEVLTEAYGDVTGQMESLADRTVDTIQEAYTALEGQVEDVLQDTTDKLQVCGRGWSDKVQQLDESYTELRTQLTQTAEDLGKIYELVTEGVQSSGIGMNAAASILMDAKAVMSGVS